MAFFVYKKIIIVYNSTSLGGFYMKKPHFYYDMTKETYNYVTNGVLLRESKKEKTILDMCLEGKTIKEISNITGYSTSTISNRKRDIYKKIHNFF